MIKIQTVVADPPWSFGDALPGGTRGAAKNYKTMGTVAIERYLDWLVQSQSEWTIGENCRLFLWRVSSMQEEALRVMRSWGFELKTELVWRKKTVNGKRWFGMGRTLRAEHETCLIGVTGKPPVLNQKTRSVFDAPVLGHSSKPEKFFEIVEGLSPGPYLELFARVRRDGWISVGDGLTNG